MPGIDGFGTVYFEKNISGKFCFSDVWKISFLGDNSDTESQLYWVKDVADSNEDGQAQIFDRNLGSFAKNTFVLELEYMFVQVNSSAVLL